MEDPPVISAKLQKKALSSKKKLKVKKVRNVLASPYTYNYWPLLDECHDNDLKDILKRTLPPASLPKPGSELDVASRHADVSHKLRSALFLGINSTLRALEKGDAAAVILAGDITPTGLISQPIVDMCSTKQVPIIIMPTLRQVVKQCLGFGCIALGVKSDSIHKQHFQLLQEKINYLSSLYPPHNGPQFEKVNEDHSKNQSDDCSGIAKSKSLSKKETKETVSMYKYRSSKAERAFIPNPPHSETTTNNDNLQLMVIEQIPKSNFGEDFVSFELDSDSVHTTPVSSSSIKCQTSMKNELKRKKISYYQPLVVKCMQPNPNKKKKKS